MNRHPGPFSLALLTAALISSAMAATVRGQAAAPAGSIDAIKGSSNVATAGPAITAWINSQVAALTSGDPAQAAAAREQMIDAVSPGRVSPTPTFLAAFAAQLDTGIAPALKHESDLVRLNAAIVVARAAERTQNPALRGATLTLLNDKSRFVALWGMKAARWILPAVLRTGANADDLLNAIVKTATAPNAGMIGSPVVVEAYDALTLDVVDPITKAKAGPKEIAVVLPYMQQLLQQRAKLYRTGVPVEPLAEQRGTLFLVSNDVWRAHAPAQKLASIQVMSDIIGLAAQHAPNVEAADRENLAIMIGRVAQAIAVVPETQPVLTQLTPAAKIDARTPPDQIAVAVGAVAPALKTIKQFAALTPPPPVAAPAQQPAPGTTQPASTAPTTATAPASTAAATIKP